MKIFAKIKKFFTIKDKDNEITKFVAMLIVGIGVWFVLTFTLKHVSFETFFKILTMAYIVRLWVKLDK